MIARTSLKTMLSRSTFNKVGILPSTDSNQRQKRFSSSYNDNNNNNNDKNAKELVTVTKSTTQKKTRAPDIPSFMPVVNIPIAELAHNAFYSLHRPLLGLSTPRPFLAGGMVGQIKKEEDNECCSEEALLQYMMSLKPFEPPRLNTPIEEKSTTTTLTVEVDPSYFLNHNNNHDEIADYLTAMQEKLDLLYDQRHNNKKSTPSFISKKKTTRRLRKRKGFFEKN